MKKKLILILLALAVVAAAAYALRTSGRARNSEIVVSGNIELDEVSIAFKTAGRLIERDVDEGSTVKKGQVVARLDNEQLLAQRDRETAALASAESQLAQGETSLAWQKANQEADLEQKKADLASNEARLLELKNGSRPQEIEQSKAAAASAQAELDRARRDWDRAQVLYKHDDISTAQYDQYRSRWQEAEASLNEAKQREALVLAGPRTEQIEAASALVMKARAALRMTEANSLEIKRRQEDLAARRAEVARSKANIALINSQLADAVAVSPVDGVVLVKAADVGEVLSPGTTVVTIGDIDHPWLRAYISETDLGRVKLGAAVKVTTDSYPGKVYEGRISFISSEAEFTPKQIQTQEERVKLVYRIKINVENPRHELKSNMPADARLVLE
jgi:HlyD family secretion protein